MIDGLESTRLSYKLLGPDGNPTSNYAIDTPFDGIPDKDENKMSVWIKFVDGSRRDGVGDRTEVAGINTERHRLNPISLFDHGKQVILPIGLALDRDTQAYTVEIDPQLKTGRANIFFYQGPTDFEGYDGPQHKNFDKNQHAQFCEQLYDLICQGLIRAGSFSYQILHAKELSADFERGIQAGKHLIATLLLELGPTVIPANMDTVRKMLDHSFLSCGKPLTPVFCKSLQPYSTAHAVQLGYEKRMSNTNGVPLDKLPDNQIPPPEWKPGVGAVDRKSASPEQEKKVHKVMKEFKKGKLRSSSGDKVTKRSQAVAVALSEAGLSNKCMHGLRLKHGKERSVVGKVGKKDMGGGGQEPEEQLGGNTQPGFEGQDEEAPHGEHDEFDEPKTEKYCAQILRRMHEMAENLLAEYDEYTELGENDSVMKHLEKKLQLLVRELEDIEGLFEQEYPELHKSDPLGSDREDEELEDGDIDAEEEDETEDDSEELERPTEDEAVEGMKHGKEEAKSLRIKHSKGMHGAGCKCAECMASKGLDFHEFEHGKLEWDKRNTIEEELKRVGVKGLEGHYLSVIANRQLHNVSTFLRDISSRKSFDEGDRVQAQMLLTNLKDLCLINVKSNSGRSIGAELGGAAGEFLAPEATPVSGMVGSAIGGAIGDKVSGEDEKNVKAPNVGDMYEDGELTKEAHDAAGYNEQWKSLIHAAKFLFDVSKAKDLTIEHRQKALTLAKGLPFFGREVEKEEQRQAVPPGGGSTLNVDGKSIEAEKVKALREVFEQQQRAAKDLVEKMKVLKEISR
jgi:Family of unknown function (DUF6496)